MANPDHTFDDNFAHYPGQNSLNICAKLIARGVSPEYVYDRKCIFAHSVMVFSNGMGRAPYPNDNTWMRALVANGNNCCPHTINGIASY